LHFDLNGLPLGGVRPVQADGRDLIGKSSRTDLVKITDCPVRGEKTGRPLCGDCQFGAEWVDCDGELIPVHPAVLDG